MTPARTSRRRRPLKPAHIPGELTPANSSVIWGDEQAASANPLGNRSLRRSLRGRDMPTRDQIAAAGVGEFISENKAWSNWITLPSGQRVRAIVESYHVLSTG